MISAPIDHRNQEELWSLSHILGQHSYDLSRDKRRKRLLLRFWKGYKIVLTFEIFILKLTIPAGKHWKVKGLIWLVIIFIACFLISKIKIDM